MLSQPSLHRDKCVQRIHSLKTLYLIMVLREGWRDIELNEAVLARCVEEYFKDLERHKAFHGIRFADQHKRAAYTIKWLVRLRPIQMTQPSSSPALSTFLVNECFALFAGLGHLRIPDQAIGDLSASYVRNMLFSLQFFPVVAETLASEMYLLECALNAEKP